MAEGTKKDKAEDIRLAKKNRMSIKDWEKSKMDKKHDAPKAKRPAKKGKK